jgi:hypothetical protein
MFVKTGVNMPRTMLAEARLLQSLRSIDAFVVGQLVAGHLHSS